MARIREKFYEEYPDGSVSRAVTSEEIHTDLSLAEVETTGPETINGNIVNCIHVKVRTAPNFEADVIDLWPAGKKVTIVGKIKGFCEVLIGIGNQTGYISSDFIKEE